MSVEIRLGFDDEFNTYWITMTYIQYSIHQIYNGLQSIIFMQDAPKKYRLSHMQGIHSMMIQGCNLYDANYYSKSGSVGSTGSGSGNPGSSGSKGSGLSGYSSGTLGSSSGCGISSPFFKIDPLFCLIL